MNYKPMTRIDYIVVHCSDTPADREVGAADIRLWHRQQGWRDIGYHYVIRRDGVLETGRPEDQAGAHAKQMNKNSIGICLAGGSPPIGSEARRMGQGENNFTDDQFATLTEKLTDLTARYPNATVLGHRDIKGVNKACPTFDVIPWWESVKP